MVYPPQFGSVAQSCPTLWTSWTAARQSSLSITTSRSSPKLMSIELMMPSSHLILCHPLLILPSTFPSFGVFSNESALCNRWPKYWSFSFSISPSNEYSGLISFRIDWLEVLAVQGTLKSLLQHHSSKASILPCSALNVTFSSVTQSYPTLCDPMNSSTAGLPVHQKLPESTQFHVHWVGDAIQTSHPLSSPSLPAFNLSQHQRLFKWVSSLQQVAKVLDFQLKHQSFQWTPRTDLL